MLALSSILTLNTAFANNINADQDWRATAFGQSTDLNFASLLRPEKVGMNNVFQTGANKALNPADSHALYQDFIIESRGGKIANSHDGMTVFYKTLPVTQTFTLSADVILEQLGPEVDGKTPAAQEAAGLFIRDLVGPARQDPQPNGFEEFPHAANVLMNAMVTQNKKNDNQVQITAIHRQGVTQPWGNDGITIARKGYQKNVTYGENTLYHMSIERTATKYVLTWTNPKTNESKIWETNDENGFMNQQDKESVAVGFFASRNAKVRIVNAKLVINDKIIDYQTLPTVATTTQALKPTILLASAKETSSSDYVLQLQSNIVGDIVVSGTDYQQHASVKAGELVQLPMQLKEGKNSFVAQLNSQEGQTATLPIEISLRPATVVNSQHIYVAPNGKKEADGSLQNPVDLVTALNVLQPGGTIYLADGQYDGITIRPEHSGLPQAPKTLMAQSLHKAIFVNLTTTLQGHHWIIKNVVFDGNPTQIDPQDNAPAYLRISGSYNTIERVIARNNADTGIAITAEGKGHRNLWPSYNQVINSDSYNNRDKSGINADGFAAKLGVGAGNIFRGCIAHHNADDGWDLFNKIENGPNEPVIIENSITYQNGLPFSNPDVIVGSIGNGFKMGGEGQPVNHKIVNSIAFANNMDGFTDNFNTGSLVIDNNLSLNNARYNFIIRPNPYEFQKPIVSFDHNISVKDTWQNTIADFLGQQVKSQNSKQLTTAEFMQQQGVKGEIPSHIDRDENGNIIYPALFKGIFE